MEKHLRGCCILVEESGELLIKPKPVDQLPVGGLEAAGQCGDISWVAFPTV